MTEFDFPNLPTREQLAAQAAGHDVVAETGPTPPSSSLAALRAKLDAALAPDTRTYAVPTRPGFSVRYRLDLSDADFRAARKFGTIKQATSRRDAEINEVRQLQLLMARYNTAILSDGAVLLAEDGEPLTFRHSDFMSIFGATRAVDAVLAFYHTEGAVISAGRAFVRDTGWLDEASSDDDAEETAPDPTQG